MPSRIRTRHHNLTNDPNGPAPQFPRPSDKNLDKSEDIPDLALEATNLMRAQQPHRVVLQVEPDLAVGMADAFIIRLDPKPRPVCV